MKIKQLKNHPKAFNRGGPWYTQITSDWWTQFPLLSDFVYGMMRDSRGMRPLQGRGPLGLAG